MESLDTRLDEISQTAVSVMEGVKKARSVSKPSTPCCPTLTNTKPTSQSIRSTPPSAGRRKKEQFAESHREELDAYNAAIRYLKANLKGNSYSRKDLESEREQLASALPEQGRSWKRFRQM